MTASDSAGFFTFANERDPPAVEDQHSVDALSWRAVRAVSGDLHLMLVLESGALRNTSAVTFVDACRHALVTSSGRAYVLHGPPEQEAVIKRMLLANSARIGLGDAEDVSESLWAELCAACSRLSSPK